MECANLVSEGLACDPVVPKMHQHFLLGTEAGTGPAQRFLPTKCTY